LTADGSAVPREFYAVEVLPGRRELQVEATWSNRWRDRTSLVVDAQAGREYVVRIHESKSPLAAAGDVAEDVLFVPMSRTAAGVLLLPGMLIDAATRTPPTRRPPWPCYLWISDNRTGQVVAGEAPK